MKRFYVACLSVFMAVAATNAARAEGMPQLDFGNKLLTAQVIWGALIFAVFYLLVARWGLPQIGSILEMRAGTIADDLDQARNARDAADAAVAELTQSRRRAYAESQAAIAQATQNAKATAATLAAEQDARLDAQLAESEAQIAQARAAAMGALREVATQTAIAVITRVVASQPDEARVHAAVADILAQRGLPA